MASVDAILVGRALERAAFEARLDDALRQDGSTIVLCGEPGLGKSRLLQSWLAAAKTRGFAVASVANFPFAREAYAPIAEACRTLARLEPRAVPRGPSRRLFLRFLELFAAPTAAADEPWQKRRLFVLVAEFLERFSSLQPFVFAVDDAQWLDAESAEVLHYVVPRLERTRGILLLTRRVAAGEDPRAMLGGIERAISCPVVRLERLSPNETRELVAHAIPRGAQIGGRRFGEIVRRSEGHPLFAEELVRHALAGGDGRSLPANAQQSVRERLMELLDRDVAVLEHAALMGSRIEIDRLVALTDGARADVLQALRHAQQLGILVEDAASELFFAHDLLREAIAARMTPPERREHHRRMAAFLETGGEPNPAELRRHLEGAGERERAATVAELAGDVAMSRYAFASAREHYEAAVGGPARDDESIMRVSERLGRVYDLLGNQREAYDAYGRAALLSQRTRDSERTARLAVLLALTAGRLPDAVAEARHCAEALEVVGGVGRSAFAANVLLAIHHANRLDVAAARTHLARAEAVVGDREPAFVVRRHVAEAAIANLCADVAGWHEASRKAIRAAEQCGDPALLANAWQYVADFARLKGEPELAETGFARSIDVADTFGLTFVASRARLSAADAAFLRGHVERAHHFTLEATLLQVDGAFARAHRSAVGIPIALATGDAFLLERLEDVELLDELRGGDANPLAVSLIAAHVVLRARRGDLAGSRTLIAEVMPRIAHAAYIDTALFTFARHGDAATATRAARLLEQGADRNDPIACVHLGLVAALSGSARRTERALEAGRHASAAGLRWLEAVADELAGETEAAIALYRAIGAHAEAARLAGVAPMPRRAGVGQLTRREREVASCIAEGLSNRAIAERLTVSDRTVEHHAAAIFAKLGVRTRTQLVTVMLRETAPA